MGGIGAVILVVALVIFGLVTGGGTKPTHKPVLSPKYRATVLNVFPSNRQELNVSVKVANIGKAAGTPQCTIDATSPGGADSGVTAVTASKPIKPGAFSVFTVTVTITHTSATLVQKSGVRVSCSTPL